MSCELLVRVERSLNKIRSYTYAKVLLVLPDALPVVTSKEGLVAHPVGAWRSFARF